MTRELIIEGQHVDLAPDTDITLEYVSNVLGEPGKINLSRSYTAKLPKTRRNARILDDPARPGHESAKVRRFLSARYYRNGIDLLGEAQAYVLSTSGDSYDVALVWNTLPALQALSQTKKTLNDLADLPRLTWIGANGRTPEYVGMQQGSDGALFAWYESGLGPVTYPDVNAATHPSMNMDKLLRQILEQAGVAYEVESERAQAALWSTFLLAAPGSKPDRTMELESGSVAGSVVFVAATANNKPTTLLELKSWTHGWDAPSGAAAATATNTFNAGENKKHRLLVNLRTSADMEGAYIYVAGVKLEGTVIREQDTLARFYFKQDAAGYYCSVDETFDLGGWPQYVVDIAGLEGSVPSVPTAYEAGLPLFAVNRVHESVEIAKDNRFPLSGNLPDIGQWEFVKSCMVMFGMVPVIKGDTLTFCDYSIMLDTSRALDWTDKVDMTGDGDPDELSPSVSGWARENLITFEDNPDLLKDPTATLSVIDGTLAESREFYKLPYAASLSSSAVHYKVTDGKVERIDIAPRVFSLVPGSDASGNLRNDLTFVDNLSGSGLVETYYPELQRVMNTPTVITERIRLHELDLAALDFRRPVYLGQYGQYYAIINLQTSDTDLCKVELLQI